MVNQQHLLLIRFHPLDKSNTVMKQIFDKIIRFRHFNPLSDAKKYLRLSYCAYVLDTEM